ncbi:PDZ/DHR/GLGF domain protein [Ancylostoma ceylanicum]|uniref:PDZ/DHR/GLGF domain protein n=1 Tax=Ancylostoma ceylanicum TaxID=53326 RepID=A0A0D6LW07_9BILA|nr:PDZ/DHR/GLGF domain protein [Ancylostoma ceylanicum]
MESIAAEPPASCQAPSTASQLHQSANDRLKLYESDVKARLSQKAQREKENDFLRSSLRQSKKLQALAASKDKPVCIDMPDLKPTDGKADTRAVNGYENQCYDQGDMSFNEKLENNNNQAIPLKQVIVSVDRITDHLSKMEGREEESKILHEYFHSEPVQAAIEAVAVHRKGNGQAKEDESSFIANGTNSVEISAKPTEPNVHVVSLFKREDSYLGATVRNDEDRIVVGRVVKGGIVEKTGLLKEGDELLEMNGVDLRGKNVSEVCELLRSISGDIRFVVSSPAETQKKTPPSSTKVKYMRALFDYDPEVIRTLGRKSSKDVQRSADEPTGNNSIGYYSDTTRPPKDGELDGIHYHFISRQRFLEDAKAAKFVEYGEFEKHMYGTAAADIVNVIRRSKTCVLTLKAESLIAVRTAEIMPFILFVAPPSLQTLRRQKECAGQFNVKDDELKAILTQGKNIEQKYKVKFCKIE